MNGIKLTVDCCLCSAKHETVVALPEGWAHRYGRVDDTSDGFCPDHAKIAEFATAQCTGCVGGWGDCPLWTSFAYTHPREPITEEDLSVIEKGKCPRRVGGTMVFQAGQMEEINLSVVADNEAGLILAAAIRAYIERFKDAGKDLMKP